MKTVIVTNARSKIRIGKKIELTNLVYSNSKIEKYEGVIFEKNTYNVTWLSGNNGEDTIMLNKVGKGVNSCISLDCKSI